MSKLGPDTRINSRVIKSNPDGRLIGSNTPNTLISTLNYVGDKDTVLSQCKEFLIKIGFSALTYLIDQYLEKKGSREFDEVLNNIIKFIDVPIIDGVRLQSLSPLSKAERDKLWIVISPLIPFINNSYITDKLFELSFLSKKYDIFEKLLKKIEKSKGLPKDNGVIIGKKLIVKVNGRDLSTTIKYLLNSTNAEDKKIGQKFEDILEKYGYEID